MIVAFIRWVLVLVLLVGAWLTYEAMTASEAKAASWRTIKADGRVAAVRCVT